MSPSLDKLYARATKCVFLGYSRLQKRYRCYSPETKKYYMFANVTIFEQTAYLSPSVQDVYVIQQVLPIPVIESSIPSVSINPSPNQNPRNPLSSHLNHLQHKTPIGSPAIPKQGESPTSDYSPSSLNTTTSSDNDTRWTNALRKATHSTHNPHPIYNFLSYHRLSSSYYSLLSSMSFVVIPKIVNEALDHPGW